MTKQNLVLLDRPNRHENASGVSLRVEFPQQQQHPGGACTVDIEMGNSDGPPKERQEEGPSSRYHTYRIKGRYTRWLYKHSWPESDSEESEDEPEQPEEEEYDDDDHKSDEWRSVTMSDDYDDFYNDDTDSESDNAIPEEEDQDEDEEGGDKELRYEDMGDTKYRAVHMLSGAEFIGLDAVEEIINRLTGYALVNAATRALEPWKNLNIPDDFGLMRTALPRIVLQQINRALNRDHRNSITEESIRRRKIWEYVLQALAIIQQSDEEELRHMLVLLLQYMNTQNAFYVLGPQLWGLSPEQKQRLDNQALAFHHHWPRKMPDEEDEEKDCDVQW
ncbi:hypothetical protein VTN77DRAFT_4392 [Rasamsonia byssochlamydoides]|uniref:uncharacterized protein n=1 Tax=Rasamsonia byssochlamydoides TaxID=89139 RepID=UPI0037438AD6